MRLLSLQIHNFRSFADVSIPLGSYNCFVGANGAGKSTILSALSVFFREPTNALTDTNELSIEDFHNRDTSKPIEITIEFCDLSETAKEDFRHYVRHDRLIVSAVANFDSTSQVGTVNQYGTRLGIKRFADFFAESDTAKAPVLKAIYAKIRADFPSLGSATSRDAMSAALRDFEDSHQDLCEPLRSKDHFYGFTRGDSLLDKYIQWIYVAAVKDATTEQLEARSTALGKLLARTVRTQANFEEDVHRLKQATELEYMKLIEEKKHVLNDVCGRLRLRLAEWAHPDATLSLQWRHDPNKSIRIEEPIVEMLAGEAGFEGELLRLGHGFQRSLLIALLQELAATGVVPGPTLLLGCEEPELYQHPPQARHLAGLLRELGNKNAQIFVTTHSPLFVSGQSFEDVRLVNRNGSTKCAQVSNVTTESISSAIAAATGAKPLRPSGMLAKIHQALQPALNEMFFTQRLVLVEGAEDVAYIHTYLNLLGKWESYRRSGCHIVPTNKKSEMIRPLAIAKGLGIPTFVVFDADTDVQDKNGRRAKHEKDNRAIMNLCGFGDLDPMPSVDVWTSSLVVWCSRLSAVVESEIGADSFARHKDAAAKQYGYAGDLDKNPLFIGTTLTLANLDGQRSASLERLCDAILSFSCTP